MAQDSFRKRYFFKLSSNFFGLISSFLVAAIVPRSLGPGLYGNYTYLTNFFRGFIGLFDLSTSLAFYTKISQRPKEISLIRFYWNYVFWMGLVSFLSITMIFKFGFSQWVWPNQENKFICMGLIWGLLIWVNQVFEKMMDAYGLTVKSEIVRVFQNCLKVVLLLALFVLNRVSLTTFFFYNYFIIVFLCILWGQLLIKNNIPIYPKEKLSRNTTRAYKKEFYEYSSPLVVIAVFSFLFSALDLWLLEKFSGSVQQGFFGFAYQLSNICFLFTSSMTPILMREFSVSFGEGDTKKLAYNFQKHIPFFYAITAILSLFLSVQADKIGLIFGGKEYAGATLTIALVAIFPIDRTYGQLSNSLFYATGRTKIHRNISLIIMATTCFLTFFMVAPKRLHGLDLGAFGLSIKILIDQILGNYTRLWFNTKYLNISFAKFVIHNISTLIMVGFVAFLSRYLVTLLKIESMYLSLMLSGIVYLILISMLVYRLPWIIAMTRSEIRNKMSLVFSKLRVSH